MLFKTGEKKFFDEMKLLVKKHYLKLSLTDRKNMYIALSNHCNSEIRSGNFEFLGELFDLNLEMLKNKAYLEGNDFMAHYIYISIAINAVNFGKILWAEKFVNRYKKMVHSDFRESSYNYCKSVICIETGKFDDALEYLSKVETLDIRFKLYINNSLLKIYFSKNEADAFFSLVDSFRHFLKRNKELRNDDRIYNNNFILFLSKLFKLKSDPVKIEISEIQVLKDTLDKTNDITNKKWLFDRLEEVLKN